MRLINTQTLECEEFDYPEIPPYAILSHTWGNGELLYEDLLASKRVTGKANGYLKLDNTVRRAAGAGIGHCWIDTCCIDKKNFSELSEAINSMFNWYKEAKVCYAYLADVPSNEDPSGAGSQFRKSRWFTRGWTLQELLAPQSVVFLASDWRRIGRKQELAPAIEEVTHIPRRFLLGADLDTATIAQRMSWAARRKTKKEEDIAYCLWGIFGVNMPLIYGEREKGAFRRLQLEILKLSDDTSIFAWTQTGFTEGETDTFQTFGLLAQSPSCFGNGHDIIIATQPRAPGYINGIRTPVTVDNKGLHLSLATIPDPGKLATVILGCTRQGDMKTRIVLQLVDISRNGGRWARVKVHKLESRHCDKLQLKSTFKDFSTEMRAFNKVLCIAEDDHEESASGTAGSSYYQSERATGSRGYGRKPCVVVVHRGTGGPVNDPNMSSSSPCGGYWK